MPSRDRILDAATEMVDRGSPLTISAVSASAGVSRGTVYRCFPNAAALADALVASGRVAPDRVRATDPTERILDAVATLLGQNGLSGMTVEDVARMAEVSPITVYRRFGDRRGLLESFVLRRTPRRLASELPATATGDLKEDLLRIAREGISFLAHHRDIFMLAFTADPEAAALLSDIRRDSVSIREAVTSYLRAAIPGTGANEAHAFLGMVLALGLDADEQDAEARAALVVSIFLQGVLR